MVDLQIGEKQPAYSHSGVSTLIYSQSETLLAGQVPVTFTAKEPFRNGLTRTVGDTPRENLSSSSVSVDACRLGRRRVDTGHHADARL